MTGRLAKLLLRPLALDRTSEHAGAARALDAAAVLGAPPGRGQQLAQPLAERIAAGADIYRRGLCRLVCATGRPDEAAAIAARLIDLGVPPAALRIDADARTTLDNARNASALLAADGCRSVWVVTQSFHRRRACYWFRRFGLDAQPWPIDGEAAPRLRWVAREYAAWARLAVGRAAGRPR